MESAPMLLIHGIWALVVICWCRIYRELSCVRFRRWIYRVLRGHVTNGVPACALDRIQQTFAPEGTCSFVYPR